MGRDLGRGSAGVRVLRTTARATRAWIRAFRLAAVTRRRHREIKRADLAAGAGARVFYGFDHVPGPGDPAYGGLVKLQHLQARYPNQSRDFNLLYLVSSFLPHDDSALLTLARRRGAAVVWNQDGVGYPAWAGEATDAFNARLGRGDHDADPVFFQSDF